MTVPPDRRSGLRLAWPLPLSLQVVLLSFVVTGVTGLSALLTARWLGAEIRGVITVAQTISSMAGFLIPLGLVQATRILLSDPARGLTVKRYLAATRLLVVADLVLNALLAFTVFPFLTHFFDLRLSVLLVVLATCFFRGQLFREVLHGRGWHRLAITGDLVAGLLPLLLIGTTYVFDHALLTLPLTIAYLVSGQVAYAVWGWFQIGRESAGEERPHAGFRADLSLLRELLAYSLPGLVAALGQLVAGKLDRLILAYFHGNAAVGVYATAATLSDLAWGLPLSLTAVIVRSVAQSRSTASHANWWRRVMAATLGLCVVMLGVGWVLLERFLGRDFQGSTPILAVLLVGSVAMASQQVDLAFCNGLGDLKASAKSALCGLVVGLPLYFVLTPLFGTMGCAWANNLTFVTMAIAARVILRRRERVLA